MLEARPALPVDLQHVWGGYFDLETERPWIPLPMGAPQQGAVPWSAMRKWLVVERVPREDHAAYRHLWAIIAEELS